MSRFIRQALENQEITVYGDGRQTRTFCYVEDNVDACLSTLESGLYLNDVVNIGNDVELSILQLAEKIIELTSSKSKIKHLPPLAEGDMTRRKPDITRMKKLLGRKLTGLEEGIKNVIEHDNFK